MVFLFFLIAAVRDVPTFNLFLTVCLASIWLIAHRWLPFDLSGRTLCVWQRPLNWCELEYRKDLYSDLCCFYSMLLILIKSPRNMASDLVTILQSSYGCNPIVCVAILRGRSFFGARSVVEYTVYLKPIHIGDTGYQPVFAIRVSWWTATFKQLYMYKASCFHTLRQIQYIQRSLTHEDAKMLVNSFICSRIDYCNAVFAGMPRSTISHLDSVIRKNRTDTKIIMYCIANNLIPNL